ncbi:hypothetical protein VNO78_22050 [Psophocarpus tetragonolobus]|uniref:BEACH domain-containing protein n=1 Tax=Psophocarpus tetragonolobus TaxID=3891 RepID=A0AAN9SHH1_PSOTE
MEQMDPLLLLHYAAFGITGKQALDSANTETLTDFRTDKHELELDYLLDYSNLSFDIIASFDLSLYAVMLDTTISGSSKQESNEGSFLFKLMAKSFSKRYESWDDPEVPKFHYGSQYSSTGIVLFYLLCLPPFIENKKLQGGHLG